MHRIGVVKANGCGVTQLKRGKSSLSPAAAASDVQQANVEEVIWQLPSQLEPQIAFGCSVEQALGQDAEVSPVIYATWLTFVGAGFWPNATSLLPERGW